MSAGKAIDSIKGSDTTKRQEISAAYEQKSKLQGVFDAQPLNLGKGNTAMETPGSS